MGILQQKKGSGFEKEFAESLARNNFWATVLPKQADGSQPFDVIAGNKGKIYCVDCKTLDGNTFPLGRIEENQERAFLKLGQYACNQNYFAIKLKDGTVWMCPADELIHLKMFGEKSINPRDYMPFDSWVVAHN